MALKWLRDQIKFLAPVLWIIVAAFIITIFFDFGTVDLRQSSGQVAATVGSERITLGEFQSEYRALESRYQQTFGQQWTPEMARQLNIPKQALDQLIDRRILLMEAESIGLMATDEEVRDLIVTFPAFQDEDGNFAGREAVQNVLRNARLTEEEFTKDQRDRLLLEKLQSVLRDTIFVSEADIEEAYRAQNEKAEIRFIEVPSSQFADRVEIEPSELQAYYDENSSDYELLEQRVVDYVLVDTVQMRRTIEIPDDEMEQYWNDNQSEFERDEQVRARHILLRSTPDRDIEAAKAELLAIKTRVEGGEDFGEIAREVSDDEGTAKRGGSLGFFGRGSMVEAFDKAAFGAEPGTLVGPVETQFGVHLIDVQDRREGGIQPFEEAKQVIRSRLLGQRVDQLAQDKINDLSNRIQEEGLKETAQLEALATEEDATFQTTQPFGKSDTVVGIGRAADFTDTAFALKQNDISQPIKVPRGWVVLRLAEIQPPQIPELAEVEGQVRSAVSAEKQKVLAVERLGEMRAGVAADETGAGLDNAAAELGVVVQESGEFTRLGSVGDLGRDRRVIDAALSMEPGQLSEVFSTDNGAVLFEVTSRTTFDAAAYSEERDATREQEVQKRLNQVFVSLIEERKRNLAPKYDARVMEDFDIQATTL